MRSDRLARRCLVAAALLAMLAPTGAAAQDDPKPETPTYRLTLPVAGPPVPSFKHELVPSVREQVPNNAALLHHRALHLLAEVRKPAAEEWEKWEKLRDRPDRELPREPLREFLRPYQNVFKEMEAAARCDRCEWGTEGRIATEGIGFLIPDVQKMRELSFFLSLRCRLHAVDGRIDLALKDVQTGIALGRHASQGGTLIHFLVGNSIVAQFIVALERVLQHPACPNLYWSLAALPRPLVDIRKGMEGELRSMEATIPYPKDVDKGPMSPEEALAALDRVWAGIQKLADEKPPLGLAESRLGLAWFITFQHPSARKALMAAGKTKDELDAMPPAQVVMLDALIRFRNLRDEHFVWYNLPYAEAVEGMKRSESHIRAVRGGPFDYLQTMLILLLPAVDRVYGAQVRTDRRLASLRAVEAVRLHAARTNGRPPKSLAEATTVPVPTDPATGKPFGYAVERNTFTVTVDPPAGEKADPNNHWKYVVTLAN
jgi:hypothetical protein